MIVVYHILLFWFVNNGASANIVLHKSICIPLHIGVILYVLISGYFGIHFSLKGVIKIISNLFVYGLLFALVAHFCFGDKFGPTKLFFVSASPFWFINIYLMLYCISPILNKIIKGLSKSNRLVLMLILFWISCYVGLLGFDDSLQYGKNLIHFVLLYLIGNTLAVCKHKINSIPLIYILLTYILINFISISLYVLMVGKSYEYLAYDMAFSYNSPLLIANAICVFVSFMRFKFHNKIINIIKEKNEKELLNIILGKDDQLYHAYLIKEDFVCNYYKVKFEDAENYIKKLIDNCKNSMFPEYIEVAKSLKKWKQQIINSFIRDGNDKRITNAKTEGFNNSVKVIKRTSYGYANFKRFRNRILYILRDYAPIKI